MSGCCAASAAPRAASAQTRRNLPPGRAPAGRARPEAEAVSGKGWPNAARKWVAKPYGACLRQRRAARRAAPTPPGRVRAACRGPRRPFTGSTGPWAQFGKHIPYAFHYYGGALALKDPAKRSGVTSSRGGSLGALAPCGTRAAIRRTAVFVATWQPRVPWSSFVVRDAQDGRRAVAVALLVSGATVGDDTHAPGSFELPAE